MLVKILHRLFFGWLVVMLTASTAPAAYVTAAPLPATVTYRLPFDASAGKIRVSRTGYLYNAAYRAAGLTKYTSASFHPALGSHTAAQRAAIDFGGSGWTVRAAADGKVIKSDKCTVQVQSGTDIVHYIHHSHQIKIKTGEMVKQGQAIAVTGGYTDCNAHGAHLHFAVYRNGREVAVKFEDAAKQSSNGYTCPAGLVCPSQTNYVEFRYTGRNITPAGPVTTFTRGSSTLWQDQSWGRANLKVCADNLSGNTVYVHFSRVGRVWEYSQKATSNCVTFWDLDGSGPLLRATTYVSRAALNQKPNTSWSVPCSGTTSGKGLCDRLTRP
jgi:hypothetical protein